MESPVAPLMASLLNDHADCTKAAFDDVVDGWLVPLGCWQRRPEVGTHTVCLT